MKFSGMLWTVWFVYWTVSARNRVRDTDQAPIKKESLGGRLFYLVLMVLGFALIFWRRVPFPYGLTQVWPSSATTLTLGLIVQTIGLAFAVWAREILGANWSARVAIGAEQVLVIRGPYRIVRHPIYSGLLLGMLGTTIIVGMVRAIVGFVLIVASVLLKLRREEAALREHFGAAYIEYARKVPALIPG